MAFSVAGGILRLRRFIFMKALKVIEKVLLSLSLSILIISCILSIFIDEGEGYQGVISIAILFSSVSGIALLLALAIFGFVFLFVFDDKKMSWVGFSFYAIAQVLSLLISIYGMSLYDRGSSATILLFSCIMYFIYLVIFFIDKALSMKDSDKGSSNSARHALNQLKEWKVLVQAGYMTEEEFEKKRTEILFSKEEKDNK